MPDEVRGGHRVARWASASAAAHARSPPTVGGADGAACALTGAARRTRLTEARPCPATDATIVDGHPPLLSPGYRSTCCVRRAGRSCRCPHGLTEMTGPAAGRRAGRRARRDLTAPARRRAARRADHRPRPGARRRRPAGPEHADRDLAGQRRRPLPARGRPHPAPLDPNFTGAGRCLTDDEGATASSRSSPGAYPWRNHHNAWRPAHIHFSLFGPAFTQRLVTQMYFPAIRCSRRTRSSTRSATRRPASG